MPSRVDAEVKRQLLAVIDHACESGWTLVRICAVLELETTRVWRWRRRAAQGEHALVDAVTRAPVHGITPAEETELGFRTSRRAFSGIYVMGLKVSAGMSSRWRTWRCRSVSSGWKVRSTVPSASMSSWRATPVKISRIRAVVGAAQPRSSG